MYTDKGAGLLSPGILAYIGDSVFELMVRSYSLEKGLRKLHDLHQNTIGIVNASSQADFLTLIENSLTEEERDIVRRGKNSKTGNIPDNTDIKDYRSSTAFEALIGYLYLSGRKKRIAELWNKIIAKIEEKGK